MKITIPKNVCKCEPFAWWVGQAGRKPFTVAAGELRSGQTEEIEDAPGFMDLTLRIMHGSYLPYTKSVSSNEEIEVSLEFDKVGDDLSWCDCLCVNCHKSICECEEK